MLIQDFNGDEGETLTLAKLKLQAVICFKEKAGPVLGVCSSGCKNVDVTDITLTPLYPDKNTS